MNNVSLILAFSAGLLSFLSPCVLPLVPAYISYLTGNTIENLNRTNTKLNTLYKSIGFTIGFSIIFIAMGASITSIGKLLTKYQSFFRQIGGILIIIFGIHTMGIFKIKLLFYEKRFLSFHKSTGNLASILMGMAFATGWTPCVGPILSSILIYAASTNTLSKGVLLLIFYSLGLAVPFILTAMAIESFSIHIRKILKYSPIISFISGVIMIFLGIIVFTNKIATLNGYLNFINF
ncbi:cytochrome c biogenesis CcdA family protein [Clostridium sp. DJ247]|uniref:cytochrome c biogenesis CcdA family protein n=1 Tax=Clostridium sp. DJ247 TaxID=2726188 RepID=UPI0016294A67|nr:cytochrome c biogenesis protein CcdA [Clostridium sp. DJ247]MBC2581815.1 cytochrome c biogenesis protein CcdA [Clostridium sp. DJ247]